MTIARQLQRGDELTEILTTAIAALRSAYACDRLDLWQCLDPEQAVLYQTDVAGGPPPLGQIEPLLAATGLDPQTLHPDQVASRLVPPTSSSEPRWQMAVPLFNRDRCWGAIAAQRSVRATVSTPAIAGSSPADQVTPPEPSAASAWTPTEIQGLQQIALQLGVAIQLHAAQSAPESVHATTLVQSGDRTLAPRLLSQPDPHSFLASIAATPAAEIQLYKQIVSATPDCIALIDRHYVYQVVNQTYLQWHARSRSHIIGQPVSNLFGDAFFRTHQQPLIDRCLNGEAQTTHETWYLYPDGQQRYVRVTCMPYQQAGAIAGVVVNVNDLTPLKQAEEALSRSQQDLKHTSAQLKLVIRAAKIGIWQWHLPSNQVVWDDYTYEIYQQDPEQFSCTQAAWQALVHPDDVPHIEATLQEVLTTQTVLRTEFRIFWPDGSIHYLEADGLIQTDAAGQPEYLIGMNRDITARKLAEQALTASETQRRLALDLTDTGAWTFKIPTGQAVWSTSQFHLMGLDPEVDNSHLQTWRNRVHPDDLSRVEAELAAAIQNHTVLDTEYRVIYPNGTERWVLTKGCGIYDPQGKALQMTGVMMDITDRKEAELRLQQQVRRDRILTQMVQDIRQTLDLEEILATAVSEVRDFLQVDRVLIYRFASDLGGTVSTESVAPGYPSIRHFQHLDTCFGASRQRYQPGSIFVTPDIYQAGHTPCYINFLENLQVKAKLVVPLWQGTQLWGLLAAHHCASARDWQSAEIDLMQTLAAQLEIAIHQSELYQQVRTLNASLERQITARTAELQQALEFEALLKRITDQVRDSLDEQNILENVVRELAIALHADICDTGIYNGDRTISTIKFEYSQGQSFSKYQSCNIAESANPHLYQQLFRGETCHFCFLPASNILRPRDPAKAVLASPLLDDQGILGDLWLFRPADQGFSRAEIRLVEQVASQCAIALRQSRLYQAAQAQVDELDRLNRLKDDFLSTVSHELRTPISSMSMATQMLETMLLPTGLLDDPDHLIYRQMVVLRNESQRELALINDLLDLARLDAATEPLNPAMIMLQFFIPHLAEPFIERTASQDQQLHIHIPDDLPSLTTDLSYLERILTELLHNACKYTPAHGEIIVSATAIGQAIALQITNSGVEIPPEECDRVFDKFHRIPNNDPWRHGGTGLGLALVRKLVEQLGATIALHSAANQVTFTIQFPQEFPTTKAS